MRRNVWCVIALGTIVLAAVFVCYDTLLPQLPDYGIQTVSLRGSPGIERVIAVQPGSTAARAGIRIGDRISYGATAWERGLAHFATPGTRVPVLVNGRRRVVLVASPSAFPAIFVVTLILRLAFLAVAALLAWRRPEDPAARALVVFLVCFGLLISLQSTVLPSPQVSYVVLTVGSTVLLFIGTAAAVVFAAVFPSGRSRPVPGALARTAVLLAAIGIAGEVFASLRGGSRTAQIVVTAVFGLLATLVVATLVAAYVQGEIAERPRRRWVFLMLGVGLVAVALDVGLNTIIGYSRAVDIGALMAIGSVPFGLAYAILRHRVLDVGFILNRAVVYGAVSAIVVGGFVILETLASTYVHVGGPSGGIVLQLLVALALGFSIRAIHGRVDRVVDRVLFRQRHADQAAIVTLTHDVHYMTDPDVVLERCVQTAIRHAHVDQAGIWLRGPRGSYVPRHATFPQPTAVDENDPAIVAMRARRVVVDLGSLDSTLPGAVALPMIVRGELAGTLVCGAKQQGESYAPDETAALRDMATATGLALDALRIRDLEERVKLLEASRG
jgi:hypothetical protein